MKQLNAYIIEKLKISKIETKYKPKTKEELVDLMIREIEANGLECSLNHIDVSNITDMSYLFRGGIGTQNVVGHPILSKFNGDISNWDVSTVKYMAMMFNNSKFNGNLSNWNVSSSINMENMFANSPLENNPPKWYKK